MQHVVSLRLKLGQLQAAGLLFQFYRQRFQHSAPVLFRAQPEAERIGSRYFAGIGLGLVHLGANVHIDFQEGHIGFQLADFRLGMLPAAEAQTELGIAGEPLHGAGIEQPAFRFTVKHSAPQAAIRLDGLTQEAAKHHLGAPALHVQLRVLLVLVTDVIGHQAVQRSIGNAAAGALQHCQQVFGKEAFAADLQGRLVVQGSSQLDVGPFGQQISDGSRGEIALAELAGKNKTLPGALGENMGEAPLADGRRFLLKSHRTGIIAGMATVENREDMRRGSLRRLWRASSDLMDEETQLLVGQQRSLPGRVITSDRLQAAVALRRPSLRVCPFLGTMAGEVEEGRLARLRPTQVVAQGFNDRRLLGFLVVKRKGVYFQAGVFLQKI